MKRFLATLLACLVLLPCLQAYAEEELNKTLFEAIMNYDVSAQVSAQNETVDQSQPASQTEHNNSKAKYMTLMVYMCGSDLESAAYPGASADILEMMEAGFNAEKVNVLLMAGGSNSWEIDTIRDGTTGIYQVGNRTIATLFNDGKSHNMGDPSTLYSFLSYAYEEYPSEKYALILWDHGSGSLGGICHDEINDGDALNMGELNAALKESPFGSRKLDWIGFDACLMSAAETAKIVSPYAEYMVASEESEPGTGWDYGFLSDIDKDPDPGVTGKRIGDLYYRSCLQARTDLENFTMACIDLSKISDVVSSVDTFFRSVDVTQDNFARLSRVRGDAISFGRKKADPDSDHDLIDLGDIVGKYSSFGESGFAQQAKEAISACVVHSVSTKDGCSGLTVYFPFYNKAIASAAVRAHSKLGFSDSYDRFIDDFSRALFTNGQSLSVSPQNENNINHTWNAISTLLDTSHRDNRTLFVIQLNDQQVAEIRTASLIAIQQGAEPDTWHLVATQDPKEPEKIGESDTLSGEYVHTNLFVTDGNGNPLQEVDVPLVYVERDDGLYVVQVILIDEQENETPAELVCSRDPLTGLVTVEAVYLYDSVIDSYSPRLMGDLSNYQRIKYVSVDREKTYVDGVLLAFNDWTVKTETSYIWDLSQPWQLAFVKDYLDTSALEVAFEITDIFNNVYLSKPISLSQDSQTPEALTTFDYDDKNLIWVGNGELSEATSDRGARLLVELKNISDREIAVTVENIRVDGQNVDGVVEVYGNGTNYSMLPEETQRVRLELPAELSESPEEIIFDLTIKDLAGDPLDVIEVKVCPGIGEVEE